MAEFENLEQAIAAFDELSKKFEEQKNAAENNRIKAEAFEEQLGKEREAAKKNLEELERTKKMNYQLISQLDISKNKMTAEEAIIKIGRW